MPLPISAVLLTCLMFPLAWANAQQNDNRFHHPRPPDSENCGYTMGDGSEFLQPFYAVTATKILTVAVWAYRGGITPTMQLSIRSSPYSATNPSILAASSISVPRGGSDPLQVDLPVGLAPGEYVLAMRIFADPTAAVGISADCFKTFYYPGYTKLIEHHTIFEGLPAYFEFGSTDWPDFKPRAYLPLVSN